jgi:HD-GYP domain-containing protein (c-di-GMP phosphodiesterase class II)
MQSVAIPLMDLLLAMSSAADLVSPAVANHHKRVAYIAGRLAEELGLPRSEVQAIVTAAAMHDIGVFTAKEREDLLQFELDGAERHADVGYRFLGEFKPLSRAAQLVRFHHTPWLDGQGATSNGEQVSLGCHLLHLADRIDILVDNKQHVLSQTKVIREKIAASNGRLFHPQMVDAFQQLGQREYFWLDVRSPRIDDLLRREFKLPTWELSFEELRQLAQLLSHIIDFKSPFTSTHTAGVASVAEALARLLPLSSAEREFVAIAGYLHDLGKLAIPAEILEKPASLSPGEYSLMRSHTYHTRRILEAIPSLETVADWASGHHERLDGTGYPFHLRSLSLGARIIAVADVFTAVTEDRPYRKGMTHKDARQVLNDMAGSNQLDTRLVDLMLDNFGEINVVRMAAQAAAAEEYSQLLPPTA